MPARADTFFPCVCCLSYRQIHFVIQTLFQISAEKDGGGLELVLKAGEKCSNRPQAISNVTATLNITIQRGCTNYVTKCKEMLMFLQEQALPKTMNIMKVHMVNRETKALAQKEDSNRLFSCIRPSKRDR